MITLREIKIRYKQSIMGFGWALLMPMLVVAVGVLVQKVLSMLSGRPMTIHDIASVSVKALPWAFFIGSVRFSTNSLTSNSNLITKIYFPRGVLPLSAVLANLVDFAVAAVTLVAFLAIGRIGVSLQLLWVPLLLGTLVILTIGVGMVLACANVFFRDVKYLVEVFLTFGIFFTPVFYEPHLLGPWAPVVLLNPLSPLLSGLADVVVHHRAPDLFWVGYSFVCACGGMVLAWKLFDAAEYTFAEIV
jgi:ABC-type polysaccharide/polyol phosphate export permease